MEKKKTRGDTFSVLFCSKELACMVPMQTPVLCYIIMKKRSHQGSTSDYNNLWSYLRSWIRLLTQLHSHIHTAPTQMAFQRTCLNFYELGYPSLPCYRIDFRTLPLNHLTVVEWKNWPLCLEYNRLHPQFLDP